MVSLVIDTREKKLIELLREKDIDHEVEQLDVGDIHIKNEFSTIVIERKTIVDMLASVKDGRYREQKERLKIYNHKLYIIENDQFDSTNKVLSGVYFSTMIRDKIGILYSNSLEQTIQYIQTMLNKMINKPDRLKEEHCYTECVAKKTKKIENIDKNTCFIMQLSQIPNISSKISKEIANKHESMKEFIDTVSEWDNPIDYLTTFEGIGKNKAEKIISYLL